jgi:hypothetical protein
MKLHDLIQSLDKSEKRYFKLYASRTNDRDNKRYMLIFNVMLQQAEYNEVSLVEELKKAAHPTTHIQAQQAYLHEMLLEALRLYHADRSGKMTIYRYLEQVEVLYEKNLLTQAISQLKKATKIANSICHHTVLPEIQYWEALLHLNMWKYEDVVRQYQTKHGTLNGLQVEAALEQLYREAECRRQLAASSRTEEAIEHFKLLMGDELLNIPPSQLPFQAQLRYHQIWAMYYYIQRNRLLEYEQNKLLIDLLDSNDSYKQENPNTYIGIYSRYTNLVRTCEPEKYLDTIVQINKFPKTLVHDRSRAEAHVFFITSSNDMLYYMGNREFEAIYNKLPELNKLYKQYQAYTETHFTSTYYYKCAYICIALDKNQEALKYLNLIINNLGEQARPDIYAYALILRVLVHYNLENWTLLPYIASSAHLLLKKRKQFNNSEKLLLKFIRKASFTLNAKQRKEILNELYTELNRIIDQPLERQILNYFEFRIWLQAHIQGSSFSKMITTYTKDLL